jgi:hypothetical protein
MRTTSVDTVHPGPPSMRVRLETADGSSGAGGTVPTVTPRASQPGAAVADPLENPPDVGDPRPSVDQSAEPAPEW